MAADLAFALAMTIARANPAHPDHPPRAIPTSVNSPYRRA
jgi:hypothetical protein